MRINFKTKGTLVRSRAAVAFLVGAVAFGAMARTHAQTPARNAPDRTAFATVTGKDDAPVAGLTAADFTVREDGQAREVLKVTPGGAPAHIAVLIDDTQALADAGAVQDYRAGLTAFVKDILAASPNTQIALLSFGNRPTQLVDYTSSAPALQHAIDRIFGQQGAGAYLLTTINDVCKGLTKKGFTDNAIVAFTIESGPEFSPQSHQAIEASLKSAGASLWTILLQGSSPQGADSDEARERAIVLGGTAQMSGGMRDVAITRIGLDNRFKALAARMSSRYAITYGRPEALVPPQKLEIASTRPGTHVLAPRWAAQ